MIDGRRFACVALLACAWIGVGCGTDAGEEAAHAAERADVPAVVWPESLTVSEARPHTFAPRETLQGVLTDMGLPVAEALRLSAAVDDVQPVRDIRPGAELWLYVAPDSTPDRFVLWTDRLSGVEVVRDAEAWRAAPVARTLDRYVRFVRGTLETNLYEAMLDAGGDAALVLAVSDILQWDVDFFVDPRPGDRFSILVEEWASDQEFVRHGDILAVRYEGERASVTAYRLPDEDGTARYFRADGTSVQRTLLKSPLNYRRISSHFSHRRFHPILHKYRPHLGVDYAAPTGTPVVSIGDGTVTFAGTKRGFGKTVVVRHTASLTTQYAHFSRIREAFERVRG